MANDFEQRMSQLTDRQLLDTIAKIEEYVPEAQAAAQAELVKRGSIEKLTVNINAENKLTPVIPNPRKKKNLWAPFGAAVLTLGIVFGYGKALIHLLNIHSQEDIQATLVEFTRDQNANTPKMIDEITRLDYVHSSASSVSYIITIFPAEGKAIDLDNFRITMPSCIRKNLYAQPVTKLFLESGISFDYSFYTKDGARICKFTVSASEKQE
jgi:hypothetical protein